MACSQSLGIAYTSSALDDSQRQFDIYYPTDTAVDARPLIVFVHGGAWRAEDKRDHASLARSILTATGCAVAVPNYRLTPSGNVDPNLRHPVHAEDLLAFLHFILAWRNPQYSFDPHKLVLIGHSCSAHMLSSIFLDSQTPSLTPSMVLLSAVKGIVLSEGIFDLDTLVARFPDYRRWFIDGAFGPAEHYPEFSTLRYSPWPNAPIKWLLIHSKGDMLVDVPQTVAMYNHLKTLYPEGIDHDIDTVESDHDDVLRQDAYIQMVKDFVVNFI
ncbi:hypothetical protein NLJ89_g846 [Agrocybe chaxingu]|uniref:BD-FAE-like domain-containing protein n=1 Tax=Agrocybe chaxingu TaxID=84603 RepID=A0A9W8N147_9AGAR|nr:hypothetical protein NLJ89_g846 [Agrocybe chaxingu]